MAGIKRKAEMEIPITDENDLLKITPLGSGNEVGRSSILLEYKGKTILVSFFFLFFFYYDNYHETKQETVLLRQPDMGA
jgi:predicted metal-dependent RNase